MSAKSTAAVSAKTPDAIGPHPLAAAVEHIPVTIYSSSALASQAVAKEIEADARKYMDETYPLVRDRAIKLAPSTLGALLEEKFTEDELKQVLAFLESPAVNKFQQLSQEMQKSLAEKLVAETQQQVEPKVRSLEQSIGKRLGVSAAAPAQGKQPAKK